MNDVVLDPMAGSGTTILEAYLTNRKPLGFDIDPLAIKIAKAKTFPLDKKYLIKIKNNITANARRKLQSDITELNKNMQLRFDTKTKEFIDYWFLPQVQLELTALYEQIEKIDEEEYKNFFQVVFSSTIITKSGGVSLALDLGHTRPHKTKILLDKDGNFIFGAEHFDPDKKYNLTKAIKSPFAEFEKRFHQNFNSIVEPNTLGISPDIQFGDSQHLPIKDKSIDLIVTSPPYASNAIDYMRAHKFSLIWFGYSIDELTSIRKEYIGAESISNYTFEELPDYTRQKVSTITDIDKNRGRVLQRYYSEMTKSLREMYRILKPQKAAIVVVGSSVMKGVDTETHICLKEIGDNIGFITPHIGVRRLDRNKRMMPAGMITNLKSQIQQRMHEEYVIGFYKP